ncbi:MAG: hypothetical protein EPN17_14110 [Methylobacter sp.]|nr:MAG: hypothetical protein EPN17_14110 [Methylobacter sp.]
MKALEWILNNWMLLIGITGLALPFFFWSHGLRKRNTKYCTHQVACCKVSNIDLYINKQQEKPEWYDVLQKEINRLQIGIVVFNPPDSMKLGVKERIEARISKDINADLVTSLKGRGLPQIEELKIYELMKVRLTGDDFEIDSLNEDEQIISASGFTEWSWDVIPLKSGKKTLHLHVTLRIRLPFGEEKKDSPVLDREITVQVNPTYSVKLFLMTYWTWLVTALILPLIGWLWKTYMG